MPADSWVYNVGPGGPMCSLHPSSRAVAARYLPVAGSVQHHFRIWKGIYILSWNSFSRLQETTSKTVEREIEDSCRRIAAPNSHIPRVPYLATMEPSSSANLWPNAAWAWHLWRARRPSQTSAVLNAAQWLCFHKALMAITSSEQVQKSSNQNHQKLIIVDL